MNKVYACIDLKSFYASVECIERGLDPITTNLVVADGSRTEKTVCLAITPSMKQYGLGGRARLFEVVAKMREVNYQRRKNNNYRKFTSKSFNDDELKKLIEKEEESCGRIVKSKRIGIDYGEEAKDFLYRFYYEENPYVSVKDKKPVYLDV